MYCVILYHVIRMNNKEVNEFPYEKYYSYCYEKDKDKEEHTMITTWNVNLNNGGDVINSNNNNSNNETACNSWIDFEDWPTNDMNNSSINTKCQYYRKYPLYLPNNFHIKQEFTTSSFYTNINDDDQRNNNTLRNSYFKLSSSSSSSITTSPQLLFKSMSSLFKSEYFINKISSIKKSKSSSTSFDFNADFIPFQRQINTIALYKEPLIDKYPKLKCVICNKQHYPIQCPRRQTLLPKTKCSICNKQSFHFEEECLSNNSLYENNTNINNDMKWCFKCGKFGHLYCNVQYPNEKAFFYEYEHINSDDESSTNNNNKHKRNNNYHNTDVLVNVKESLLMNDNNFFDSADNIII